MPEKNLKAIENRIEPASSNNFQEAKALIEQEKQLRVKRCEAKINKALQEERCGLESGATFTNRQGFVPILNIFAMD